MVKFLEAGFDQSNTMSPRVGSTIANEGACHNFSLHWLRMILGDTRKRPSERMDELHKNKGGVNIVLQRAFTTRWAADVGDFENADAMIMRLRGLDAKSATIPYGVFSKSQLKKTTLTNGGCGYVYSFWFSGSVQGASGGAHSIAMYRSSSDKSSGFYHVFDPNFGEFMILPDNFVRWFSSFSKEYGPFNYHMLRQVTVVDKDKT